MEYREQSVEADAGPRSLFSGAPNLLVRPEEVEEVTNETPPGGEGGHTVEMQREDEAERAGNVCGGWREEEWNEHEAETRRTE